MQDTLRGSRGLEGSLGGSWDLLGTASDHHNTVSQGPGTFRAVSEGPGTFWKQRQTTANDPKMTEIINIDGNDSDGSKWAESPSI